MKRGGQQKKGETREEVKGSICELGRKGLEGAKVIWKLETGTGRENDEDEIELAFNRDTIIQRWTPLMFVAQWNIMAAIQVASKLKCSEEGTTHNNCISFALRK